MLKLFKYELRKTLIAKLILLGITACLEAFFLYTVMISKDSGAATISIILLILTAVFGILFIGIQSIVTLHHDMNTKQSYMLFMTPNSNYAILGAKAMECIVSVVITGVFFFGLGMLDIRLLFGRFGNIQSLIDFATQLMNSFRLNFALDVASIAAFTINTLVSWLETVLLAFFADVVATALLKGKKFGGLLTFLIFVVLSAASNKIVAMIPGMSTSLMDVVVRTAVMMVISIAVYIGSATIMEKKLSV